MDHHFLPGAGGIKTRLSQVPPQLKTNGGFAGGSIFHVIFGPTSVTQADRVKFLRIYHPHRPTGIFECSFAWEKASAISFDHSVTLHGDCIPNPLRPGEEVISQNMLSKFRR